MKYTILGNCQAAPISKLLAGQPDFSAKFEFLPMPAPVHMFKPHHLTAIHNVLASVDLFIYQNISDAFGPEFNTEELKKQCKTGCKFIAIPSLYFTGYFPSFCYLRHTAGANEFSPYHDINFVSSFLKHLDSPIEHFYHKLLNDEFMNDSSIIDNAKSSLIQLRSVEQATDVKVSDFIEAHWLKRQLFYTPNHPSIKLLEVVVSGILALLELKNKALNWDWEPLSTTQTPIYHPVSRNMQFKAKSNIVQSGKRYTLKEYLANQLAVYQTVNKDALKANFNIVVAQNPQLKQSPL